MKMRQMNGNKRAARVTVLQLNERVTTLEQQVKALQTVIRSLRKAMGTTAHIATFGLRLK